MNYMARVPTSVLQALAKVTLAISQLPHRVTEPLVGAVSAVGDHLTQFHPSRRQWSGSIRILLASCSGTHTVAHAGSCKYVRCVRCFGSRIHHDRVAHAKKTCKLSRRRGTPWPDLPLVPARNGSVGPRISGANAGTREAQRMEKVWSTRVCSTTLPVRRLTSQKPALACQWSKYGSPGQATTPLGWISS